VTGLVCHRHPWEACFSRTWHQRRGVRTTRLCRPLRRCSSIAPPRPPHPAAYVRDDRETPLVRNGTKSQYSCFYLAVKW